MTQRNGNQDRIEAGKNSAAKHHGKRPAVRNHAVEKIRNEDRTPQERLARAATDPACVDAEAQLRIISFCRAFGKRADALDVPDYTLLQCLDPFPIRRHGDLYSSPIIQNAQ